VTIVVIGPPAGGKSTLAGRLARATGLPLRSFDAFPERWYRPFGWTEARAERRYESGGAAALHRYQARFEARALHRACAAGAGEVIDPGGGVLRQYTPADAELVAAALRTAGLVLLACPFPDNPERAAAALAERMAARADGDDDSRYWMESGGWRLAEELLVAAREASDSAHYWVDTAGARWWPVRSAGDGERWVEPVLAEFCDIPHHRSTQRR
jgi:shikimate kinase